jgi:beta-lactamase class A/uncharacterized protein YgiM (DUF1202 family)
MRRLMLSLSLAILIPLMILVSAAALAQSADTGVYAEALGTANLRAGIGLEAEIITQIQAGTRYPVLARSQFYPWLLLGTPNSLTPLGWVFQDLVTVTGNINALPFSEADLQAQLAPTSTLPPTAELITRAPVNSLGAQTTPTALPTYNVYGLVNGEINLRYGPGADYPRLGVARPGDRLEIIGYHLTLPWVQIRYPSAPFGVAWVARDVIEIIGNPNSTNPISQTDFSAQPTLTPTPALVLQPAVNAQGTTIPVSPEFARLANTLWNRVLTAGFDPQTSKFAALYVRNLVSKEEFSVGSNVAFNGTSVNKITILAAFFNALDGNMDYQAGVDLANTMICSENVSTNSVLSRIGGGDMYLGAEAVTSFLTKFGLKRTFLTAPYETPGRALPQPTIPIRFPRTDVDQTKAEPNVTNQMTVDEMGHLLQAIYECGMEETGPLLTNFTTFTPQECRKMLYLMQNNTVDAFFKAGVPENVPVAHKHGWVNNTHGNAAIIFSPGGAYIMVMMMYQPTWLNFQESLPLAAELSREMYNALNPENPLLAIRDGYIPPTETCNYAGSELVEQLISPFFLE